MNTLPYELAKELKDAGFPFEDISDEIKGHDLDNREPRTDIEQMSLTGFVGAGRVPFAVFQGDRFSVYRLPTLSELIEACPKEMEVEGIGYDGQFTLRHWLNDDLEWHAGYHFVDGWYEGPEGIGPTLEIAVARLWLALNV